ncbi:GW dipeptide domain-containing protein [Carnobacterium inhibens]|uniref:GW domain-containing glycosaminoglycan-binding protein n=1 Tax=Carnobacterium inhibens TaxID=147709 RepID=A0ABR7TD84_9LACT|nr:GW dipeptide domain-containing protein [Carnobacterium inhibens]MBC9825904.1 GW domain-containing glycosaminoglycan-binding protein [Carnobacterium inhibens]
MRKWENSIQKVITLATVVTMLSPIVLSTGVSAVESNNASSEVVESTSLNEAELQESSVLTDEEQIESTEGLDDEGYIEESSNSSEENITESEEIQEDDSTVDEKSSDNETSLENEEYFSIEENREKAMEMMEQEKNSISTFSMKSRSVSKTNAFINAVSSTAVSVANEYDLYASVMIAQAALESAWGTSILAYAPNYNLFGIKAGTGDAYFTKYSKEYSAEKGWTIEKSNFKKYPSYKDTFIDYAKKLRKGPDWNSSKGSWDPKYYSGTWKENTTSYKNATSALIGKYATDPSYGTKLNDIIKAYNLTQYDTKTTDNKNNSDLADDIKEISYDEITSTTNVKDYTAYITGNTDGIYSQPKGTANSKVNADASGYLNQKVIVTEEATTKSGASWAKITLNGNLLGWIDKSGITIYDIILSEKTTNYTAKINRKTDTINTKPYGTKGYETKAKSSEYYGKDVKIIKEAVTERATWALITLNGKELGWIDKEGLDIEKITSTKDVSYTKYITRKTDSIGSEPYGTEGYKTKAYSSEYYGKKVNVLKEATTRRATWALISLDGKELGWIDMNGLSNDEVILSEKTINYIAKINRKTDTINTKPYGTKGYDTKAKSSEYFGKDVKIIKEAVTERATWALITLNGKELGWIDKKGLDIEKVTSTKNVSYTKVIDRKTDSISSKPYGTEGYKINASSSVYLYYGKEVKVLKEAKTRRSTWALISLDGKELGWIDMNGLSNDEVILSEKTINYIAKINRKTDTINTKPYGTKGYETKVKSSEYYGKDVKIIKEAVTERATWALITLNGKELGWIDKAGLDIEKVTSTKNVSYTKYIARKTDSINTKPWGTEGYKKVASSSDYLGKKVTVIKEAKTRRATWALISIDGKEIGWIDMAGLTNNETILSEKAINYTAKINRKTDGINTRPYGTEGAKKTAYSSEYYGKQVKITKEIVTERATWALISLNGKELGWIDKAGLDIEKVTSTTDVADYKATIIRTNDTINSKPYGTEGYVTNYSSSKYVGTEVTVTKEAKTRRATWALISLNGKELGWIDKSGLNKINPFKKTVYVDAGHGGKDPGAQSGGVNEKDLNLKVALKVRDKLEQKGYNVVMSRTTDVFLELSEIARKANNSKADIFVSIHHNSFNKNSYGIESFSYNSLGTSTNAMSKNLARLASSEKLAKNSQQQMISYTGAYNRGAKKANFHVIRETNMPAVLLELGFVDNTSERSKLVTNNYQEKLANGIVQGIVDYFK